MNIAIIALRRRYYATKASFIRI